MILIDLSPMANHLWQSTMYAAAVWLLTLVLGKKRAAVRYSLWLAASVKFLIPFSLFVSIGSQLGWRTAPAISQVQWPVVMDDIVRPFAVSAPLRHANTPLVSDPLPALLLGVWFCGFAGSLLEAARDGAIMADQWGPHRQCSMAVWPHLLAEA